MLFRGIGFMTYISTLEQLPAEKRYVLGIGFFDGCHKGHQAVFREVKTLAQEKGAEPAILTFYPHPMTVLAPDVHVPLLQSQEEKLKSLEEAGMAVTVCMTPDRKFLSESAEEFLHRLSCIPGLKGIVTGANFTFGKGALGHSAMLETYFQDTPVTVKILSLQQEGQQTISSTEIRQLILKGEVDTAAQLLGRPYAITGDVVHGFRRGHEALGFPTANLDVPQDRVIPADGVYATYANVAGKRYPSITNVGNNPTFGNTKKTIETFIFDFDESIYGKQFTLEWVARLRGEKKFDSVSALMAQIQKDIVAAKEIVNS